MGSGASKADPNITEDMIDTRKYMVVKNSGGEVRFYVCLILFRIALHRSPDLIGQLVPENTRLNRI